MHYYANSLTPCLAQLMYVLINRHCICGEVFRTGDDSIFAAYEGDVEIRG